MSETKLSTVLSDGLWRNNVVLVQGLCLCPAIAVTTSATNGLGLGLLTLLVLVICNLMISVLRHLIPDNVRIPAFIILIATVVTVLDQALNAWGHALHQVLGLFVPLIVTNCAILGRAEAAARKMAPLAATVDGLGIGLGFAAFMVAMGGIREVIGAGTLFADASMLLGPVGDWLTLKIADQGLLIVRLPAGGFMVFGLLLAGRRLLQRWPAATKVAAAPLREV